MKIGTTINLERLKQRIKQNDLANLCEMSKSHFSQIEHNAKEPSKKTLKKISEHLNISVPILILRSFEETDIKKGQFEAFKLLLPMVEDMLL